MQNNNFKLVTAIKIIGLSALLGTFWFLAAKLFVDKSVVDGNYLPYALFWYIFMFLPISILSFSKTKGLKIFAAVFGVIGIIFVIGGIILYVSDSSLSNNTLFEMIFGAPPMVLLYSILLLGGEMH